MKTLIRTLKTYSHLVRFRHWIKNLLIFAPLIFAMKLFDKGNFLFAVTAFFSFSFVSVLIYILNDIHDIQTDALHPVKSKRPLPSGEISIRKALLIGALFFSAGIFLSLTSLKSLAIVMIYFIMNLFYTYRLKHIVILDVFIIALGFCLRVLMGAVVIKVSLSSWMLLATFSVSLVLGFGKRRHELVLLKEDASSHRNILGEYSKEILDIMITISTGLAAISYALYTMESGVNGKTVSQSLILTFPVVVYGLYRYLYIVYHKEKGGSPEEDLITDRGILLSILIWGLLIIGILYFRNVQSAIKLIDINVIQLLFNGVSDVRI